MKKSFSVILSILMLLPLIGCGLNGKLTSPVDFYYCVKEIDHTGGNDVIRKETREGSQYREDLIALLNAYLEGPESDELYNPFPAGSEILNYKREGNVLTLYLSAHFDRLPLDKLTLAAACLVQTTYHYTSALVFLLIPNGTFIDGTTYKTLNADSFLYSDENINYATAQ